MNKMNLMKFNSIKKEIDSYTVVADYMFSYSKFNKNLALERFDFNDGKKHIIVKIDDVSATPHPDVLEMNTYDAIDFLLGVYKDETRWITW
jgi:hypothetical protein